MDKKLKRRAMKRVKELFAAGEKDKALELLVMMTADVKVDTVTILASAKASAVIESSVAVKSDDVAAEAVSAAEKETGYVLKRRDREIVVDSLARSIDTWLGQVARDEKNE
jgi:hypothetical protein